MKPEKFREKLKNIKHIDNKLDFIFNTLDNLLIDKDYKTCNNILEHLCLNIDELNIDILVGLLTITYFYKKRLPKRKTLYNLIENIVKDIPNNEGILDGLK